ncbi:MAG: hypothetical protein IJD07_01425 [Clostridia bacterium]|nr:hypothetical protein [Clostridia bacterium]
MSENLLIKKKSFRTLIISVFLCAVSLIFSIVALASGTYKTGDFYVKINFYNAIIVACVIACFVLFVKNKDNLSRFLPITVFFIFIVCAVVERTSVFKTVDGYKIDAKNTIQFFGVLFASGNISSFLMLFAAILLILNRDKNNTVVFTTICYMMLSSIFDLISGVSTFFIFKLSKLTSPMFYLKNGAFEFLTSAPIFVVLLINCLPRFNLKKMFQKESPKANEDQLAQIENNFNDI